MKRTKGDKRVGRDFNPSGKMDVDAIKQDTASIIDRLELVEGDGETMRCVAIAQTKYEEAAMWAVKAMTKTQEQKHDREETSE